MNCKINLFLPFFVEANNFFVSSFVRTVGNDLFFLGVFRASLIGSIIFFSLYLSPLDSKYFCHSISYSVSKNIAPTIYLMAFKVYNKISSKIVANKEVAEYYEAEKPLL